MIWYYIWYDMLYDICDMDIRWYMLGYDIWYDMTIWENDVQCIIYVIWYMIYDMIWYDHFGERCLMHWYMIWCYMIYDMIHGIWYMISHGMKILENDINVFHTQLCQTWEKLLWRRGTIMAKSCGTNHPLELERDFGLWRRKHAHL